ncbi:hypothetical protein KR044_010560 [Drosophila immigrans]|nr:hypothetical protein KR044_010560 [Drosophila immigrans]
MSDDDCDIFNVPTMRADGKYKQSASLIDEPLTHWRLSANKLFMPNQELKQTEYDFIEVHPIIKKPTKLTKLKPVPSEKPKAESRKPKKLKHRNEKEPADKRSPQKQETPPPTRDLSPVSQMILERESRQVQAKPSKQAEVNIDAALEALPVARRTRAGRRSLNPPPPELEQEAVVTAPEKHASPPKQRAARGRKRATGATAAATSRANVTIPDMFLAGSRGNRRQVAEIAARSQVLDSIDMVSAVMPRIEGFVNLDSDDENSTPVQLAETALKETHQFDEDNPEIDINLSWLGEIQMYKLRQYQKFSHMFKQISERNNVPIDNVVVNMDANFIKPHQTPLDVGLKVFHILNGYALASSGKQAEQPAAVDLYTKPKKFQLKVQGDRWKRPLIILMNKSETFKVLYIKCAEEMECAVGDFKLYFDGELLEPDDTPKNQQMEGNEMIDLRKK